PRYFRYLTLILVNIFLEENIIIAIYKAGIRGENNTINIIRKLVITSIISLGINYKKTL
ncbi:hypothetical protein BDR22DRAFT_776192, partial [Usnea florida]